MTQKYSLLSSTFAGKLTGLDNASIQLSDGTHVFLAFDFAGSVAKLYYSSDHATATLIASVSATFGGYGSSTTNTTIVRDASDNIYVIGRSGTASTLVVQAFTKTGTLTWSAGT